MHDAVQYIALFGMVGIGVLFVVEVRRWRAMGPIMSRRQRVLRVALIMLIEALFVMMLIGPMVTERKDPISSLLYWTICLILGLSVVVLALFDLKTVASQYIQLNRQMFRDLKGIADETSRTAGSGADSLIAKGRKMPRIFRGDDRREK